MRKDETENNQEMKRIDEYQIKELILLIMF